MICDLMEYYHILNYKDIQPDVLGVLVFGLRENSRIKMNIMDSKLTTSQTLEARMVDALNLLVWSKTEDAKKGRNMPKSILELLNNKNNDKECKGFRTIEEFESELARLRS